MIAAAAADSVPARCSTFPGELWHHFVARPLLLFEIGKSTNKYPQSPPLQSSVLPGDISGVNENTPDTTLFLFVDLYVFTYVYASVCMCTYVVSFLRCCPLGF